MSEVEATEEAVTFIRALVNAWDCCGTCAGGVLAKRDREIATRAEAALASAKAEALREVLDALREEDDSFGVGEGIGGEYDKGVHEGIDVAIRIIEQRSRADRIARTDEATS